jgi:hypothetical protein
MLEMRPMPTSTILDVGVIESPWREGNFLEAAYPWPERITGVAPRPMPDFGSAFPEVRFVEADGRDLPFPDQSFDIGFSNAVVEHVGSREQQARFVRELVRTSRRTFVATPNRGYPLDPHTLLPFIHWLPDRWWRAILRRTGHERWADPNLLNPLSAGEFLAMFPAESRPRLVRQRLFGLTSVLMVITEGR